MGTYRNIYRCGQASEHDHGTDAAGQAISTASSSMSNAKAAVENGQRRGCRNRLRRTGRCCPTKKRHGRGWQHRERQATERCNGQFYRGRLIALLGSVAGRVAQTWRVRIHGHFVHAFAIRHTRHGRHWVGGNLVLARSSLCLHRTDVSGQRHLCEEQHANHGEADISLQCSGELHALSIV